MIGVGVLTASDKGFRGERTDESGVLISKLMKENGFAVVDYVIVPDEKDIIISNIKRMADQVKADLILTTGGTGFSSRDITPEATLAVIDRQVPGIPEAIRLKSITITSMAMLSRAVAGIRNQTLIINLPGSPKAVKEGLEVILPVLPHAIQIMKGQTGECART